MHTSGGRVSIVVAGVVYSARGEVTLNKSGVAVTVKANSDGTIYKTVEAKPRTAKCTFDRFVDVNGTRLQFDENLMLQNNIAATFIEKDTNITHLLTNGTFMGDPSENLAQGEVDGVEFAAENYQTV